MTTSSTTPIPSWPKQRAIGNRKLKLRNSIDCIRKPNLEATLASKRDSDWRIFHCLGWSKMGKLLASGDKYGELDIWDPFSEITKQSVCTQGGTVKEVRFVDGHDDRFIVSCSNVQLRVTDLATKSPILDHYATGVHCLMTHQSEPNLIWTCNYSSIEQIDIRQQNTHTNAILKFDNKHICSAINPARSELLAVGTGGCIKLVDRRLINLKNNISSPSITFVPSSPKNCHRYGVEKLIFSQEGSELLANFYNDDVYLFDIKDSLKRPKSFKAPVNDNERDYKHLRYPKFFGNNDKFVLATLENKLHVFDKHTAKLVDVINKGYIDLSTLEPHPYALIIAAIYNQDRIALISTIDHYKSEFIAI